MIAAHLWRVLSPADLVSTALCPRSRALHLATVQSDLCWVKCWAAPHQALGDRSHMLIVIFEEVRRVRRDLGR